MTRDAGFLQYVLEEVLPDLPGIFTRSMFSGYGLYKDGVIFGMILGSQLYFKTDELTRGDYESYGSKPFSFEKKNKKIMLTAYYEVPLDIMENKEKIGEWAEQAMLVGKRAKK